MYHILSKCIFVVLLIIITSDGMHNPHYQAAQVHPQERHVYQAPPYMHYRAARVHPQEQHVYQAAQVQPQTPIRPARPMYQSPIRQTPMYQAQHAYQTPIYQSPQVHPQTPRHQAPLYRQARPNPQSPLHQTPMYHDQSPLHQAPPYMHYQAPQVGNQYTPPYMHDRVAPVYPQVTHAYQSPQVHPQPPRHQAPLHRQARPNPQSVAEYIKKHGLPARYPPYVHNINTNTDEFVCPQVTYHRWHRYQDAPARNVVAYQARGISGPHHFITTHMIEQWAKDPQLLMRTLADQRLYIDFLFPWSLPSIHTDNFNGVSLGIQLKFPDYQYLLTKQTFMDNFIRYSDQFISGISSGHDLISTYGGFTLRRGLQIYCSINQFRFVAKNTPSNLLTRLNRLRQKFIDGYRLHPLIQTHVEDQYDFGTQEFGSCVNSLKAACKP
eukprot:466042_1